METMLLNQADLEKRLRPLRTVARVKIRFLRSLAGGLPADEKGIRAFVEHHLMLTPDNPEHEAAVKRIMSEEIGERETTPNDGELKTKDVYQINLIRRGAHGPFILDHMLKAVMKQAASRVGLFVKKIGSKGDLAEMGSILAHGDSLQDPSRPWEIYLRKDGKPAKTWFEKIQGKVSTPQGAMSISHHTEVAEEGAEFEVEIHWPPRKLAEGDMVLIMAAATKIGFGSCLALGYGKIEVVSMEIAKRRGKTE